MRKKGKDEKGPDLYNWEKKKKKKEIVGSRGLVNQRLAVCLGQKTLSSL